MNKQQDSSRFLGKNNLRGALLTVVFAITFFIPTPYYIYQPGTAEELSPKVTVEGGEKDEQGTLMLTTVMSIKASNIYYLAYGYVAPHSELRREEEVKQGMSDAEYERLLKHMMDTSQQNAIIAGLHSAGEEVKIDNKGIFVKSIVPASKAAGVLEVGDVITKVDGKAMTRAEDLIDYMNHNKKPGDRVELTYSRDGATKKSMIEVVELGAENQTDPGVPKKVGLGILPENEISLDLPRKVTINAEDIGGPSAGLMFSLEIYSQATKGDLTKGYRIAGTGTMNQKGEVGQIGGIRHKIVAAHKEGAEIFFSPADVDAEDNNTKDILDEAEKLGYKDIKVVPVATLQEAIDYLEKLPPKTGK